RLVNTSSNGLKVAYVEDPGVLAAIPTDGVDGMEVEPIAGDSLAYLYPHFKLARLGVCFKLFRAANVAFTIGGVLEHLAILVEIAVRGFNGTACLDDKETTIRAI